MIVARIIPLLAFALWIFSSAHIPNNFSCPWRSKVKRADTFIFNDTVDTSFNLTFIDCTNPFGERSQALVVVVAAIDISVVIMTCLELGYIAWCVYRDRDFMTDQEFCTVYLLRKRKRIRKFVNKARRRFNPGKLGIKDDFGGPKISLRPIEDIYVNVMIQEGEEQIDAYPRAFDRHEIYQCHLKIPRTVIKLTEPSDIFKPKKDQTSHCTYPRTILVIGRPGIGKTMLTRKFLHEWKRKEDEFWHDKVIILIQLREFNDGNVSFRDIVLKGIGIGDDFERAFYLIMSNQKNTILIFDGLDELTVDRDDLNKDPVRISGPNEKMPAFLILKMLLNGDMLPDLTVLITSRPTAIEVLQYLDFKRTVEILGFFEDQIKDYVFKFCENDEDTAKYMWNHIKGSGELLSLCYVPVNSYIVCLTLKEIIENEGSVDVPKTVTELYKRATKVLIYRHHPKCSLRMPPNDYLIKCFPKELKNDLLQVKQIAKDGIEKGKLIFREESESNFAKLANCGFFYKLADKRQNYFCFLHLTLQEFFAALCVVDDMDNIDKFLEEGVRDPKWHLVIQFVAGLIGDKMKSDPKEYINDKNVVAVLEK